MKHVAQKSALLGLLFLISVTRVSAEYVLPYPSYMPGNKLYKITRIFDKLKKYWYWGNIGGIKYHQNLGDKYFVESKTLFEYKQYLLATDALLRSNDQLNQLMPFVQRAGQKGIDTVQLRHGIAEDMQVQISLLNTMKLQLPKEFVWTPEKVKSTNLSIGTLLDQSLLERQSLYSRNK